jgi:hypothetical protein
MMQVTDTEVKQRGLGALIAALGEVDAERFIMLLNREPFDYTRWQKDLFPSLDVQEISRLAMKHRNERLNG